MIQASRRVQSGHLSEILALRIMDLRQGLVSILGAKMPSVAACIKVAISAILCIPAIKIPVRDRKDKAKALGAEVIAQVTSSGAALAREPQMFSKTRFWLEKLES